MQFVGMTLNDRCVEPEFALQPLLHVAARERPNSLRDLLPERVLREFESANRPGERVHVKISFEEARAVRDGEESGPAGVSAESTNTVGRDLDWLDDLGQKFKCGDVLYTLAVRVEDVRKAVEKANPVRSLLGVCVEDGQAIRRWDDSLEGLPSRGVSAHGPRRTQPVLGNARTDSLSNAPRFRAPGPVA